MNTTLKTLSDTLPNVVGAQISTVTDTLRSSLTTTPGTDSQEMKDDISFLTDELYSIREAHKETVRGATDHFNSTAREGERLRQSLDVTTAGVGSCMQRLDSLDSKYQALADGFRENGYEYAHPADANRVREATGPLHKISSALVVDMAVPPAVTQRKRTHAEMEDMRDGRGAPHGDRDQRQQDRHDKSAPVAGPSRTREEGPSQWGRNIQQRFNGYNGPPLSRTMQRNRPRVPPPPHDDPTDVIVGRREWEDDDLRGQFEALTQRILFNRRHLQGGIQRVTLDSERHYVRVTFRSQEFADEFCSAWAHRADGYFPHVTAKLG